MESTTVARVGVCLADRNQGAPSTSMPRPRAADIRSMSGGRATGRGPAADDQDMHSPSPRHLAQHVALALISCVLILSAVPALGQALSATPDQELVRAQAHSRVLLVVDTQALGH